MRSASPPTPSPQGLASALHSGEPAYAALPAHSETRLRPALQNLLAAAIAADQIRADIAADELLGAIARLSVSDLDAPSQAQKMVALLADSLRKTRFNGANASGVKKARRANAPGFFLRYLRAKKIVLWQSGLTQAWPGCSGYLDVGDIYFAAQERDVSY